MARLIDVDKLIDFIDVGHLRHPGELCYSEVDVANLLLHASTVDAVEVVHGRWRCHGDCGVTECSVCGWSIEEYVGDYAYCPNCGAKMDLEG